MLCLLQVDFPQEGPFGEEMSRQFKALAESINEEPGFLWKIWTENAQTQEAGGIYAFDTEEHAACYLEKHSKRLAGFGIVGVRGKIFAVNSALSRLNHAPLF